MRFLAKDWDKEAPVRQAGSGAHAVNPKVIAIVLFPGGIGGRPGSLPDLHLATAADNADVHGCKKDMCNSGICMNGYSTTKK